MDRRDFVTSLLAGGILGTSSWSVRAAAMGADRVGPVDIVLQGDLAQAVGLANGIGHALNDAGVTCRMTVLTGSELASYRTVSALLPTAPDVHLLGVMDDASAVIFQALAAAQGSATLAVAHHRFAAGQAGLCCDAPGLDSSLRWHEALPVHAQRIGRLYLALLGGTPPTPGIVATPIGVPEEPHASASLASFLITT